MTNSLTMCKLETMIYASEDGTYSVFTLNHDLQKQLSDLATQHPEVCYVKQLEKQTFYRVKSLGFVFSR